VLDVGCGTGGMLQMLREFGTVEGIDSSELALAIARAQLGSEVPLSLGQLPDGIPSGKSFDLITAFDVLEHIPDVAPAARAIRDALSPQGWLVCSVPAYQFLWSRHDELNHHCRRYTRQLLTEHLEQGGFRVDWSSHFNSLLFPPIAAVRLLRKVIPDRSDAPEMGEVNPLLNRALETLFGAERVLLRRAPLPVGVSILAFARPAP
jgi:2-polyprenyl-3-methyl-5-hydroxy-6-metoxy-1,4-benzoquinol methylase